VGITAEKVSKARQQRFPGILWNTNSNTGIPDLHGVDATHDELKFTDVVLHTEQPRGFEVKAQIQHHSLPHASGE
jgi:hypothetical protein